MSKGRLCVVTAHFLRNYGSVLQAFALQKTLEKCGYEVDILNYKPNYSSRISKNKTVVSVLVRVVKNNPLFAIKRKLRSRRFQAFRDSYMNLTRKLTTVEEVVSFFECEKYDAIICGSDQIWNPHLYGGFNPVFFLVPAPENSLCISYAPSIKVKCLTEDEEEEFKVLLNKFSYISVREQSSVELLENCTNKTVKWVCDPTLLLSRSEWDDIRNDLGVRFHYGVVYEIYSDSRLERFITQYNKKIPFYNISNNIDRVRGASNHFSDIGPLEFISLISKASIVVTNSFHCVVFCIIYDVKFLCFQQENDDRLSNLLEYLGLSDHIVKNYEEAIDVLSADTTEYSEYISRLQEFKDESKQFLVNSLRGIHERE